MDLINKEFNNEQEKLKNLLFEQNVIQVKYKID